MHEVSDDSDQGRIKLRLDAMGIRTRLIPGGRCVLASMHTTGRSLATLTGSLPISEIVFATAGRDRIKCLRPRALFALPLIRMADCKSASSLESRIRAAWSKYMTELHSAESWLRGIGADVNASSDGSMLNVSIAGEGQNVKIQVCQPRKVILPSCGPLSGMTLLRPEDRVLEIDPCIDSAVDLEIAVSTRLAELASLDRRLKDDERRKATPRPEPVPFHGAPKTTRPLRILLVGEQLCKQRACIDSLRVRNYQVETARSMNEAIAHYNRSSPELIFADVNLGRSEGIELIPSMRAVVGIEEIPVILVDQQRRSSLRRAAKQAGAIGYLTYPIDVSRISSHLEETLKRPKRRRFTRYAQQLAVKIKGSSMPSTALAIGRGGVMIRTDEHLAVNTIQSCDVSLPATGKHLTFDAEVIYQVNEPEHRGLGLRFQSMSAQQETNLIDYLHCLH